MITGYEEDFKEFIVEMVKAGRRPDELAKEYGPLADSIQKWVKKYSPIEINGEYISADELKKIAQRTRNFKISSSSRSLSFSFCNAFTSAGVHFSRPLGGPRTTCPSYGLIQPKVRIQRIDQYMNGLDCESQQETA